MPTKEVEREDINKRFKEDKNNEEALAVLADYTRASYRDINDDLRGKKPTKADFIPGAGLVDVEFNEKEIAEVREKEKALEYGYDQLKPLEQDTELYRGALQLIKRYLKDLLKMLSLYIQRKRVPKTSRTLEQLINNPRMRNY